MTDYHIRKGSDLCVYPGCPKPPGDASDLCQNHHRRKKARQRKFMARKRASWKRRKRCKFDGRKRHGNTRLCVVCLARLGRLRKSGVDKRVDKSARVSSRTIVDRDGRTRYLGKGKRGAPPISETDRASLALMLKAVQQAIDGLDRYESPEVEAMPRIQRNDIRQEYVALTFGAAREGLELCKRGGWTIPGLNDDSDEIAASPRKSGR